MDNALARYKKAVENGVFSGTFKDYVDQGRAEDYRQALTQQEDFSERVEGMLNRIAGPQAKRLNQAKRDLANAGDTRNSYPG